MTTLLAMFAVLPWADWAALLWFFAAWVGYARFARRRSLVQPSVLAATNRIRRLWMLQTTRREVRVLDGVVVQSLSVSPSFFASTTILIIGGLLAVLGAGEFLPMCRRTIQACCFSGNRNIFSAVPNLCEPPASLFLPGQVCHFYKPLRGIAALFGYDY